MFCCVCVWVYVVIFLDYIIRRRFSESYSKLCLNFWGTIILFPKRLHHFASPLAICRGCNFSISLTICVIICLFVYNCFRGCQVTLIGVLICITLMKDNCFKYGYLWGENSLWFNYSSVCYYSSSYFKKKCQWDRTMMCRLVVWYSATNALLQMEVLADHCTWSLFQLMLHQNWEIVCVCVCVCVCVKERGQEERETER